MSTADRARGERSSAVALQGLAAHAETARARLAEKHRAREAALTHSRDATRHAANAIRAAHRDERERTTELLEACARELTGALEAAAEHPEIATAGFVTDAQKEYAEARLTAAALIGERLPGLDEVGVPASAWLNGLAETIGELRRRALDRLAADALDEAVACLEGMDEAYAVLVTMDFPEGVTDGLRRATDVARGLVERTRGDVTNALVQDRLRAALEQGGPPRGAADER